SLNLAAARRSLQNASPDIAELKSVLDDIDMDKGRAVEVIDRMRRLFKQGAIELHPIMIDEVVRNSIALVSAEAKSKHVVLHANIPAGLPPVFGDPVHLSQVLLNLLTNSIHALETRPLDGRLIMVEARADTAGRE